MYAIDLSQGHHGRNVNVEKKSKNLLRPWFKPDSPFLWTQTPLWKKVWNGDWDRLFLFFAWMQVTVTLLIVGLGCSLIILKALIKEKSIQQLWSTCSRCIFIHPVVSVGLCHSVQPCYAWWLFLKDWFPTFATWRKNTVWSVDLCDLSMAENLLQKAYTIEICWRFWGINEFFERHPHESHKFVIEICIFFQS